jgi:NADPH-dependent 2,4-dienoyl-CoA reductase/sulfur reductase-like enzyme
MVSPGQERQMPERLVVIGGDAGGMSAAAQARRRRGPDDLEIIAFEKGRFTSYSACGIPYWIGDVVGERDDLIARSPQTHREEYSIDVRTQTEVTAIDLDRGVVEVVDLEGVRSTEGFDELLVATGATPTRPPLPGIEAEGIHGVQTLEDGDVVRRDLDEVGPRHAVVVGGGYIGLEMAEAFCMRGLDVTVVEQDPQPMSTLDPDMGALVADAVREIGITVRTGVSVDGFEVDEGRVHGVVVGEATLPAEIVVLGLGVEPNVKLAEDAGIPIGESGGIAVDRRMRTRAERVWAAGDCTEKHHRVTNRPVAFALGTHANKQGRVAGINLGGGYATFPGVVGTAVSTICGLEIARTGLTEREAEAAGFAHVTATVRSTTRAGYYPGAESLTVKVVAERRSGALLGAQIVGREGAGKRIDVFATALWCGLTVDELVNVDLSYAPPVAPLWDPVLIAARKAWQAVEEQIHDH